MMSNAESQQENIEIVRAALDNARAGRLDAAEPFFADDFILYEAEGLPFGGVYRGWRGYTEVLEKLNQFWSPGRAQHAREFIPYGDDKVIIHFTLDGNITKNGRHVQMPIVAIWELRDGKISSIRPFFFDTKRIADLAAM
jgi:ketosteroid isomerase-like protein